MKVYLKQPIEAEQFDGSNEMVDKYELIDAGTMLGTHHSPELYLTGSGKVDVGDWIETGVNGERWLITDEVFKQKYKELPVIPENVAYIIKQAGFDIEVEKADYDECHSFIANFDFSKLPDLVNAVKENIIVNYPERDGVADKDVIRLTIYDDYLE